MDHDYIPDRRAIVLLLAVVLGLGGCVETKPVASHLLVPEEYRRAVELAESSKINRFTVFFGFPYAINADDVEIRLNGVVIFPTYLGMRFFPNPGRDPVWDYEQAVEADQVLEGSIIVRNKETYNFSLDPSSAIKSSGFYRVELYHEGDRHETDFERYPLKLYVDTSIRYGLI